MSLIKSLLNREAAARKSKLAELRGILSSPKNTPQETETVARLMTELKLSIEDVDQISAALRSISDLTKQASYLKEIGEKYGAAEKATQDYFDEMNRSIDRMKKEHIRLGSVAQTLSDQHQAARAAGSKVDELKEQYREILSA
jgi:DNA repair ATPase RecN